MQAMVSASVAIVLVPLSHVFASSVSHTHRPKLSQWYSRVIARLPEFEKVHAVANKVALIGLLPAALSQTLLAGRRRRAQVR